MLIPIGEDGDGDGDNVINGIMGFDDDGGDSLGDIALLLRLSAFDIYNKY